MKKELPTKYNPSELEDKWYKYWEENNYFKSLPNDKKPYTIVIPPPNVTGVLHMGHMLNNTIQDVLIRRARMKGFNACWVPGIDHASIATEAKVVAKLKEEGIKKDDLTREEFLNHCWEWTDKHGGIILEQLKKLGASCDWDRTKFTMDEEMNKSVIKVFVDLYNKGLIYRGYRMVNWDPEAKTTISNEEVIHKEKQGKLYHIKYQVEGENNFITIATTRPETIFGDTAICINPNDDRFKHLKGKKIIVPICNRVIPIIEDEYVDMEFGTGCLKITPAHDPNDKEIGDKHNLEVIDIFNDDASLNDYGLHYKGKDRFKVRKEIILELEEIGILEKIEEYKNKVGTSERTGVVIEPKISKQWFLKMEDLVKPALENVENDTIKLHPKKFKNTYHHWMENIRDWNISRQLSWGHQIPVYYYGEKDNEFIVANSREEAINLLEKKGIENVELTQDKDALDTWFSSWIWPISVFDGINNPNNKEIEYYYPTEDLVTGPDILFFWVARMIIAGYEFKKELPFKNVYLTGLVRDKKGRKMSKSLGNSPDPIELMNQYGADSVRMGMLLTAPAGNDLPFDTDLCNQGKNFCNKIWNAFRLVQGWEIDDNLPQPKENEISIQWIKNNINKELKLIEKSFEEYRISEALMGIYKLIWDEFCSWYLEMIKPEYQKPIDRKTYNSTIEVFENLLKLLHPFMPFITEELWQHFNTRKDNEAIIISNYPKTESIDTNLLNDIETVKEVISNIRTIRKNKGIANKEKLNLKYIKNDNIINNYKDIIIKISGLEDVEEISEKLEESISFIVNKTEYFIPFEKEEINQEEEKEKLEKELKHLKGFLIGVQKKLSNEKFVNNAPAKVLEIERKKEKDALDKIKLIEESLSKM